MWCLTDSGTFAVSITHQKVCLQVTTGGRHHLHGLKDNNKWDEITVLL